MRFWISADWLINHLEKQWHGFPGGFTPRKKPERETCVGYSHVHCVDVSFVIKSVGANGFSYFLFLLFCARKWMDLKTSGGWEKLACMTGRRTGEKSKWARDVPANFEPSGASRAQSSWASRARLSPLRPLRLGKSEKKPIQNRKQL